MNEEGTGSSLGLPGQQVQAGLRARRVAARSILRPDHRCGRRQVHLGIGPIHSIRDGPPVAPYRRTGGGWTTSVTALAVATTRPNKAKGSWTHRRRGPIVNTPRRLVGSTMVDEALVSESIRSHRIRRPTSVAHCDAGWCRSGRGSRRRASGTPVVRGSVETQRREAGTAPMRQLHQEAAASTDGYQGWGDHQCGSRRRRHERRGRERRRGRSPRGRATATSTRKRVESPVLSATASTNDGDEGDRNASPRRS